MAVSPEEAKRRYAKIVRHLSGAFASTLAFAVVTWADPTLLLWALALITVYNLLTVVFAYYGWV